MITTYWNEGYVKVVCLKLSYCAVLTFLLVMMQWDEAG